MTILKQITPGLPRMSIWETVYTESALPREIYPAGTDNMITKHQKEVVGGVKLIHPAVFSDLSLSPV